MKKTIYFILILAIAFLINLFLSQEKKEPEHNLNPKTKTVEIDGREYVIMKDWDDGEWYTRVTVKTGKFYKENLTITLKGY